MVSALALDSRARWQSRLRTVWEASGASLVCARTTEEARQALQARSFDVVLLDVNEEAESAAQVISRAGGSLIVTVCGAGEEEALGAALASRGPAVLSLVDAEDLLIRQVRHLVSLTHSRAQVAGGVSAQSSGALAQPAQPTPEPAARLVAKEQFLARLTEELDRGVRSRAPVSLLIMHVEGLDEIRGHGGKEAHAAALQQVAELLLTYLRRTDCLGVVGEDLFGLVLPDTPRNGARFVAEKMREAASLCTLEAGGGRLARVRIAAGAASFPEDASDVQPLLTTAYAALSEARAKAAQPRS